MTIITRQRSDNFAVIPNAVAEDNRLSFSARGLLVYLLAKPNNWQVKIADIRNSGGIGRDQAYKLLTELKEAGYIEIEKKRTAPGTFASHNYLVYDSAIVTSLPLPENTEMATPLPDLPDTVKPDADEPDTANPDAIIKKQEILNTHSSPLPPERTNAPPFQDLWDAWPYAERPDIRQVAEAIFAKLIPADQRLAIKHADAYRKTQILRKEAYLMIPYLKKRGFRDFEGAPPINSDGNFIITPDRPEWGPWIEDMGARNGSHVAAIARESKLLAVKTRWPLGYVAPDLFEHST